MKYLIRSRHRAYMDGFGYALVDRKPSEHHETLDYDVEVFDAAPVVAASLVMGHLKLAKAMCEAGLLQPCL